MDVIRRFSRRGFLSRAAVGVLPFISGIGCSAGRRASNGPASVILVVLDTVRAKNCGAWGYHRNTTPCLDALAATSTMYAKAITAAPWTLPAHVSLFTGEYTMEHGVRGYIYTDENGTRRIRENSLAEAKTTLAERLYHHGYKTASFSANTGYMAPHYKLAQGFETYYVNREPGIDLVDKALKWVDAQSSPYFLFCNIMDAHRPYNISPCPDTLPEPVSSDESLLESLRIKTLSDPENLDGPLAAQVEGQYDLGIANADKALGRLLDGLKARGTYDDTLVIVCADHGEYLGEHGLVEHSKDVYQEAIHVPLVVKSPRQRQANVVHRPVSLTQVPATVLPWAGLEKEALPPALHVHQHGHPIIAENYFSRDWDFTDPRWAGRFDRIRTALYEGSWKYIHSTDGADALYNLDTDPNEQDNQKAEEPDRFQAMRSRCVAAIATYRKANPEASDDVDVPPESTQDELRALGYL